MYFLTLTHRNCHTLCNTHKVQGSITLIFTPNSQSSLAVGIIIKLGFMGSMVEIDRCLVFNTSVTVIWIKHLVYNKKDYWFSSRCSHGVTGVKSEVNNFHTLFSYSKIYFRSCFNADYTSKSTACKICQFQIREQGAGAYFLSFT
jgi:hypothetical protein